MQLGAVPYGTVVRSVAAFRPYLAATLLAELQALLKRELPRLEQDIWAEAARKDIQTPELDGMAAARAIRVLTGPGARVPIVALTATAMADDPRQYLAAGMDDYVSKPVDAKRLAETISRVTAAGR